MTDLSISLISSAIMLTAVTIVSLAALRGWGQWVSLRRHEIDQRFAPAGGASGYSASDDAVGNAASRIDLADLRERVRKLEAIAAGVDL